MTLDNGKGLKMKVNIYTYLVKNIATNEVKEVKAMWNLSRQEYHTFYGVSGRWEVIRVVNIEQENINVGVKH